MVTVREVTSLNDRQLVNLTDILIATARALAAN